jgi:hypothetical protein
MDSKNIFIACSAMLRKAEWEKPKNNNEWSFVGDGARFLLEIVQENINNYFTEDELYLVTDRHKSKEIKKENAANEVRDLLKYQDVTLCNKEFKRFIVFNHIGVAKQGEYHS